MQSSFTSPFKIVSSINERPSRKSLACVRKKLGFTEEETSASDSVTDYQGSSHGTSSSKISQYDISSTKTLKLSRFNCSETDIVCWNS